MRSISSGVTRDTVVVVAILRMNSSAASIMPASTAIVRSANTVREKVSSHTLISVRVSRSISGISRHSPMFHATTNRIADNTASGTRRASGASHSTTASNVSACTIPAIGVLAPERMFVAVRAMAPVAGMPPNSGVTMLAMP